MDNRYKEMKAYYKKWCDEYFANKDHPNKEYVFKGLYEVLLDIFVFFGTAFLISDIGTKLLNYFGNNHSISYIMALLILLFIRCLCNMSITYCSMIEEHISEEKYKLMTDVVLHKLIIRSELIVVTYILSLFIF